MLANPRTIFISYRRETSAFIARAVFQALRAQDYDVFMDIESIHSGDFGGILLKQIAERAHFVLILTRGSVDRCADPDDWLRREIEHAIDRKRNVVPVMVEDFAFKGTEAFLTGKLAAVPNLNALRLYNEFFDAGIRKLCEQFLDAPVATSFAPAGPPVDLRQIWTEREKKAVDTAGALVERSSEHLKLGRYDAAIADAGEALRYNPRHALAYSNRGLARCYSGDLAGALADLTEAIRLDPTLVAAHNHRGLTRNNLGDFDGALGDLNEALRLDPTFVNAYANRGVSWYYKGNPAAAIADFRETVRLDPTYAVAYSWLGMCYDGIQHFGEALDNYLIYLRMPGAPPNDYVFQRAQFLRQFLGR